MNASLSAFMRLALTAIVIAALVFIAGYKMLEDETDKYKQHIEDHKTNAFR